MSFKSCNYFRQGRHLSFRDNEWANLARTEKSTDPETGEALEDEEVIEDTPLLVNLKVSDKIFVASYVCLEAGARYLQYY